MKQALVAPLRIKFRRGDGTIVEDAIRGFFNHEALLEPYARNTITPAAVLTEHSWIPLCDIVEFLDEIWLAPAGRLDSPLDETGESEDAEEESKTAVQVAVVDFDEAYSVSAGEEVVDSVYFDVAQDAAGAWFMSAALDCDSSHYTDNLVVDDGPYPSEEDALRAGLNVAREWMAANAYSDYEVDSRLARLVDEET